MNTYTIIYTDDSVEQVIADGYGAAMWYGNNSYPKKEVARIYRGKQHSDYALFAKTESEDDQ